MRQSFSDARNSAAIVLMATTMAAMTAGLLGATISAIAGAVLVGLILAGIAAAQAANAKKRARVPVRVRSEYRPSARRRR